MDPLNDPVTDLTELFLQPLWASLNMTVSESKHIGPWICTGGHIPCPTQSVAITVLDMQKAPQYVFVILSHSECPDLMCLLEREVVS